MTDLHIVNTIDKKSSQNSGFDPGTVPIALVYAFLQEGLSSLLCFSIVDLKCAWMIANCVVDGYTAMFENMLLNNKLITGKSNIHRHILPSYTGCSLNIVFFLKMLWFFWTLPVLLQRWCSTCLVCAHTLTLRENRERSESGIF